MPRFHRFRTWPREEQRRYKPDPRTIDELRTAIRARIEVLQGPGGFFEVSTSGPFGMRSYLDQELGVWMAEVRSISGVWKIEEQAEVIPGQPNTEHNAWENMLRHVEDPFPTREIVSEAETSEAESEMDWGHTCLVCGSSPVVSTTGMCGPCTFGEADF